MAHFLCHLGCSHFGALLLDFYFTENSLEDILLTIPCKSRFPLCQSKILRTILMDFSLELMEKP